MADNFNRITNNNQIPSESKKIFTSITQGSFRSLNIASSNQTIIKIFFSR